MENAPPLGRAHSSVPLVLRNGDGALGRVTRSESNSPARCHSLMPRPYGNPGRHCEAKAETHPAVPQPV